MADMRDVLEGAAKTLHESVRACELYDPNVCEFKFERGWHPVAIKGFPFSRQLGVTRSKRKVSIFANPEYVSIQVKGARPGPAFCIGQADRLFDWQEASRYVLGKHSWPVFVRGDAGMSQEIALELNSESLKTVVAEVLGDRRARLHLHENQVSLYFQPSNATRLIAATALLLPLIGPPKARSFRVDAKIVPKELQTLVPLLKRWAESDDLERSRLLESASRRSLEKLVGVVQPHLGAIDSYLGSFRDAPMPEIATLLGTLAECSIEAELLLAKKTQR